MAFAGAVGETAVIRGKGRVIESLPLPADVGAALALYLREDRGIREGRRVFHRVYAPPVGLRGPAGRRGLHRATVAYASWGSALGSWSRAPVPARFRGTQMIRKGASLAEISLCLETSLAKYDGDLCTGVL